MVSLSEETRIPAPLSAVWPLLRDPEVVASCIPGAELAPSSGDGLWRGSIRVKFGPTVAAFRGEASLNFDDDAKTCTIEGRGIDQRGASRALASGTVLADGDATATTLKIDGEFNVTGPLETFANAGGVHVARALLAEFSANLAALAQDKTQPAAGATPEAAASGDAMAAGATPQPNSPPQIAPQPQRPPAALNGFSLLWKIIKSALGGLIGKKGN